MTFDQFKELFVPIAMVWTNSQSTAEIKASSYYEVLKKFSYATFKEACLRFVEISPQKIPMPAEFASTCYEINAKNPGRNDGQFEPDSVTHSESANKARREFYQKVKDCYDVSAERELFHKTGMKSMSFAIAEAIILEPDRLQRAWVRKHGEAK